MKKARGVNRIQWRIMPWPRPAGVCRVWPLVGLALPLATIVLYSRIKPDLAAPPKLCFASGNGHRTTACQLRDLANEMANRTGSGGNHNRLSGPWAAYIKYRNKLKFYPGNALLV